MSKEIIKDVMTEGVRATPPVAVVAHQAANGWTISYTLTAITIVYVLLQIGFLLWRWNRAAKGYEVKGE